jgi:hypothetical protein
MRDFILGSSSQVYFETLPRRQHLRVPRGSNINISHAFIVSPSIQYPICLLIVLVMFLFLPSSSVSCIFLVLFLSLSFCSFFIFPCSPLSPLSPFFVLHLIFLSSLLRSLGLFPSPSMPLFFPFRPSLHLPFVHSPTLPPFNPFPLISPPHLPPFLPFSLFSSLRSPSPTPFLPLSPSCSVVHVALSGAHRLRNGRGQDAGLRG